MQFIFETVKYTVILHKQWCERHRGGVTNSTLVSRTTYASQAWWGMISMGCRERLQATFKKVIKQGLLPANHRSFSEICDTADRVLFASVLSNPCHSLHHLLPPKRQTKYDLRKRAHDREIPITENSVMKKTLPLYHFNLTLSFSYLIVIDLYFCYCLM